MGQLLSKSRQIETNDSISLYQIYLPKLHENILKYSRLNLFKEITTGYNHVFQMTLGSPARISSGLLV